MSIYGATGVATRRAYDRLPAFYRSDDLDEGEALLRFMSLWLDQASEVEELFSDVRAGLGDPDLADAAWLPWLAQMAGVEVEADATELELRAAIGGAVSGYRVGTKEAIADAARTALTGDQDVWVYDHSTSSVGDGGAWDVLVITRPAETPDSAEVLAAIVRKHAKPAGVKLWYRGFSATWDAIVAAYPTWNAIAAAGSWNTLEQTGV
jgi:phage tail-like protein